MERVGERRKGAENSPEISYDWTESICFPFNIITQAFGMLVRIITITGQI